MSQYGWLHWPIDIAIQFNSNQIFTLEKDSNWNSAFQVTAPRAPGVFDIAIETRSENDAVSVRVLPLSCCGGAGECICTGGAVVVVLSSLATSQQLSPSIERPQ